MDSACSQEAFSALIREKSAELGGVEAALRFVHKYLRESLQKEEVAVQLHNVFPPNRQVVSTGKLCRCRGMIQEMEPSMSFYRASCSEFFGTGAADDTTMLEANLLYVIPVPGNAHFYNVPLLSPEESGAAESIILVDVPKGLPQREVEVQRKQQDDAFVEREMKRRRQEGVAPPCHNTSQPVADIPLYQKLNIPHPPLSKDLHTACIVTVIQHGCVENTEKLRLNDVVDFFGFIDDNSQSMSIQDATGGLDEFESFGAWHTEEFPSVVLSRMTCISWNHVYTALERPLLPHYFKITRPFVLQYLTGTICEGDSLVAEYLLLHLSARVISHESITPVGDVPLRVEGHGINPELWSMRMRAFAPVGEVLLDVSQLLSDEIRITPKQDPRTNVLQTGVLQLANGTHVTLDCRSCNKAGTAMCDALFFAIHKQILLLEYPYQVQELPINIGFLALSTEKEENVDFLKLALSVRWVPEVLVEAVSSPGICADQVREYFSLVHCLRRRFDENSEALRLSERLMGFCKIEQQWNNHDSFIHNNSFAMAAALMRACAASFGREVITDEDVEHVFSLERQRMARNRC